MRQIETCTDLAELKKLTITLMRGHFQSRAFICLLLEQSLPHGITVTPNDVLPSTPE